MQLSLLLTFSDLQEELEPFTTVLNGPGLREAEGGNPAGVAEGQIKTNTVYKGENGSESDQKDLAVPLS